MSGERTCIVSRKRFDRVELLRFALSPDGEVVPDILERLPGRGVWVEARASRIAEAVIKNAFSRGFGCEAKAGSELVSLTDAMLEKSLLASLAICRKAGQLCAGFMQADKAVRSSKAVMLLHAREASADGVRKLGNAVGFAKHMGGGEIAVDNSLSSAQLSSAIGQENVMHAALLDGGATANFRRLFERLARYRDHDNTASGG